MSKLSRRTAIALPWALPLALLPFAARAQFPDKPLRWLVGYPAGGGTDVLARLLAASMQPRLGQAVVIENRPGAATALAAEALVRAPADGHTVMTADIGTLVFNPALYKRLPYDANADFRPLGLIGRFHLVLAVKAASTSTTASDLIARAKAEPDKLTYGSPGVGSPHHIAMERLLRDAGAKLEHAPYRGMAPVLNDLLAGSIEAAIVDYAAGGEALRAGRIRPLAVASASRLPGLPDVPTITEALGLAGFEAYAWQGLVARTATPDAVAARLTAELAQALADPAVLTRMREIGLDPLPGTPAQQAALQASEQALWWPLIKALKIELD